MLKCTYIIFIYNNQSNIPILINSLKNIIGDFKKEYIFIDDGSDDFSLSVLKNCASDLPRTTIITQENLGPAISINKALGIATGDYVHFVEGNEELHPKATITLTQACKELGTDVAFGKVGTTTNSEYELLPSYELILEPIAQILAGKFPEIRNIGKSGSLVSRDLLEKIGRADSAVYAQNISLSLRCGSCSKFAFVNSAIAAKPSALEGVDRKFEAYNNLKSVYNFTESHRDVVELTAFLLLINLSNEAVEVRAKINYKIKALLAKYLKLFSLDDILGFYQAELNKLF